MLRHAVKLSLIPGWQSFWKWSSMRFLALGGAVQVALLAFPQALQQYLPPAVLQWGSTFVLVCMVLGGVGRITTTNPQPPSV